MVGPHKQSHMATGNRTPPDFSGTHQLLLLLLTGTNLFDCIGLLGAVHGRSRCTVPHRTRVR